MAKQDQKSSYGAVSHQENMLRGNFSNNVNLQKTHCPQNHKYDSENTYYYPDGRRLCRVCNRDHTRRYRLSKKRI